MPIDVSPLLMDDYWWLAHHMEGKKVKKVLTCHETMVTLLLENDVVIKFQYLEDEIIFDIELPSL